MIKFIIIGLWICAITLASSYTAASWKADTGEATEGGENLEGLNYEKTGPINVPMVVDGAVEGYVVAQFVFTADAKALGKLSVPPNPFIVDEAFRTIYADERIDIHDLKKFDIGTLAKVIAERVNARFGTGIVKDVLVEQFTYVSKDEVRAQAGETAPVPVLTADGVKEGGTESAAGGKPAPSGH